jgi:heme/copper-type cytochrome/quinol oxidase subunit 1
MLKLLLDVHVSRPNEFSFDTLNTLITIFIFIFCISLFAGIIIYSSRKDKEKQQKLDREESEKQTTSNLPPKDNEDKEHD